MDIGASIIGKQVEQGAPSEGSGSAPSQARASAPTVPSSPTRTPPTRRSSRTTTLRYMPRVASASWTTSSPGSASVSPNAARSKGLSCPFRVSRVRERVPV
ncbi:hypothetical protein SVIOM74S_02183 [Streptomyces violarus]